jgi:ABC-type Zn uptake system ZnuABC Zn-binding protein ZnuA
MRRILLALISLTLLIAVACSGSENGDDRRLRVVATTTQIGDFARQVGGDRVNLTVLLKPNQDAHDFEPEPSQLRAITQADVVLRNGIGLDTFVSRALENSDAKHVVVTEGITLREGEEHEEAGEDEEAHEEAGGHDPHVWLSVANARDMVENVRDAFTTADPVNSGFYSDNARAYLAELDALDADIRASVASLPPACRKLVTNHDVLGYYAAAYGFEVIGSVIPATATDAQPSAADVAAIVRSIRAEGVQAIFAETSVNPALIRQVGREAGIEVVDDLYGDSLGAKGSDGDTFVKMMRSNTEKIVTALKDCRA